MSSIASVIYVNLTLVPIGLTRTIMFDNELKKFKLLFTKYNSVRTSTVVAGSEKLNKLYEKLIKTI
jgi:hypothetical protein